MEVRSLEPGDIDRSFDIRTRSFGLLSDSARAGAEAYARNAIDQRRIVGSSAASTETCWWAGP